MRKMTVAVGLLGTLISVLAVQPAEAQATRTWVSGVGDDANPCSRTAPCKTFAGAISKTAAGGEINCLDPGGFGAVTITKSMTIDCTGTFGSTLNSGDQWNYHNHYHPGHSSYREASRHCDQRRRHDPRAERHPVGNGHRPIACRARDDPEPEHQGDRLYPFGRHRGTLCDRIRIFRRSAASRASTPASTSARPGRTSTPRSSILRSPTPAPACSPKASAALATSG